MEQKAEKFQFKGGGGDLFIIYLVNILLTMVTLGIYSFWARVKVTKFLYQNTEFMEEPFDYHATGGERFIGFLKAAGILIVYGIVIGILSKVLSAVIGKEAAGILLIIIIYATILTAIPVIMIGSERYRLSRSSWSNVRFKFSGKTGEFLKIYFKGLFLSIVTLGIYGPWFYYEVVKYFFNNYNFGKESFIFIGEKGDFVKKNFAGFFLTVITLGIYSFWWQADVYRYIWKNTSFQGKFYDSTITGGSLFLVTLKTMLLAIFSLGIGIPWAVVWQMNLYTDTFSLEAAVDLAKIEADDDDSASALADGMGDAASALDTVGSFMS